MRYILRNVFLGVIAFYIIAGYFYPPVLVSLVLTGPLMIKGMKDYFQRRHTILRNYPLFGNIRFLFEGIRPEIQQYFVENNNEGAPFSRDLRSVVYQRAKKEVDTIPFGTQKNVNQVGYMWVSHSINPSHVEGENLRIKIGGPDCTQPYSASIFNISAMSFGSLSKNAIRALNEGAKLGKFYHNTGEGGVSPYHIENGGDLVFQFGTSYFGCRSVDGGFSPEKFTTVASHPNIKMIEVKLSQGAKPGHGGILPARKLTPEIAAIRGVPMGKDVNSPPGHSAFSTPREFVHFIAKLRKLSNGKPIGFKLCVGEKREFVALCKAMIAENIYPDFITVDGGEGGTGAAPLEFSNSVGSPLTEGLVFVQNTLVGFGIRDRAKVICAGKVITGFDLIHKMTLGADVCNSARGMMMALGCIQALRCNLNTCPVGIATQDPGFADGLDVGLKSKRVANYHSETIRVAAEMLSAMGVNSPAELKPSMILRRTGLHESKPLSDIIHFLKPGDLIAGRNLSPEWMRYLATSSIDTFREVEQSEGQAVVPFRKAS